MKPPELKVSFTGGSSVKSHFAQEWKFDLEPVYIIKLMHHRTLQLAGLTFKDFLDEILKLS